MQPLLVIMYEPKRTSNGHSFKTGVRKPLFIVQAHDSDTVLLLLLQYSHFLAPMFIQEFNPQETCYKQEFWEFSTSKGHMPKGTNKTSFIQMSQNNQEHQ